MTTTAPTDPTSHDSDPDVSRPARRRRVLGITAAGVVCAGLATTGVLVANSAAASSATPAASASLPAPPAHRSGAKPPTPKPTIDGKIAAVSGDTVTVTDTQGFTRTVAVTSGTSYTRNGSTSDAAAMTTGEYVHAVGSVDSNGTTLDASSIALSTKALPGPAAGPLPGGGPGAMGGPGAGGPGAGGPGAGGPGAGARGAGGKGPAAGGPGGKRPSMPKPTAAPSA